MSSGGDAALVDAHAKIEEMASKVHELTIKTSTADEMLKDTQRLLRGTEAKSSKLETEKLAMSAEAEAVRVALTEALDEINMKSEENMSLGDQVRGLVKNVSEAKAQLTDALESLDITKSENMTLGQKVAELVSAMENAKKAAADALAKATGGGSAEDAATIAQLRAECRQLESSRGELNASLEEATAEAERAAEMHETRCKAKVEEMAARMRAEADARDNGTEMEGQLSRLLAEKKNLEDELLKMSERASALDEERSTALAECESLRERLANMPSGGGGNEEQLAEMRAHYEKQMSASEQKHDEATRELKKARSEMDTSRTSLANALAELDIKIDENMTLGEHVRALVAAAEDTKRDAKKQVDSVQVNLQNALKDLGITTTENKTLKQYIEELMQAVKEARLAASDTAALEQLEEQVTSLQRTLHAKVEEARALGGRVKSLTAELARVELLNEKLTDEGDEARQETGAAKAAGASALSALKAKLTIVIEKLEAEVAHHKRENRALLAELHSSQSTLTDALGSVGTLTGSNLSLSDQVHALVSHTRRTAETLRFMTSEFEQTIDTMEAALVAKQAADAELERTTDEAEMRLHQVQQGAKKDREVLISAALRSLEIMRTRVDAAASSSGMQQTHSESRSQQQDAPTGADAPTGGMRQWQPKVETTSGFGPKGKHRWGQPPDAQAMLNSLIMEQTSQTAPPIRRNWRGRTVSHDEVYGYTPTSHALVSPRLVRRPGTMHRTPFADAVAVAERARIVLGEDPRFADVERCGRLPMLNKMPSPTPAFETLPPANSPTGQFVPGHSPMKIRRGMD